MNVANVAIAHAPTTVLMVLCRRCGFLRAPRPGKAVCGPCEAELAQHWTEVTPLAPLGEP